MLLEEILTVVQVFEISFLLLLKLEQNLQLQIMFKAVSSLDGISFSYEYDLSLGTKFFENRGMGMKEYCEEIPLASLLAILQLISIDV